MSNKIDNTFLKALERAAKDGMNDELPITKHNGVEKMQELLSPAMVLELIQMLQSR